MELSKQEQQHWQLVQQYLKNEKKFDREQFQRNLIPILNKLSPEDKVIFAIRSALRLAWKLPSLAVKNGDKLDRFYGIYFKRLAASWIYIFNQDNAKAKRSLQSAAAAAAYAAAAYDYADAAYDAYDAAAYAYADAAAAAADAADAYASASASASASADAYASADAAYASAAAYYAADAADAAATYNKFILADLDYILKNIATSSNTFFELPLFGDKHQEFSPPSFPEDDFWGKYFFGLLLTPDKKIDEVSKEDFKEAFLAIPEEVFAVESAKSMADFMTEYFAKKVGTTKQARILILGKGGAGKTTLIRSLQTEEIPGIFEPATPRIEVLNYQPKNSDVAAEIWDFGGQVIMHATHEFFISSDSTYIVVCSQRADEQPDAWLEMIKRRAQNNAKLNVLVVFTFCENMTGDEYQQQRRENRLKRLYDKVFKLNFCNVNLSPDQDKNNQSGFDDLKSEVDKRINKEGKKFVTDSVTWFKKGFNNNFLSKTDLESNYKKVFPDRCFNDDLRIAKNYGYVFFSKPIATTEELADDFILVAQRHWLTYGVYGLVNGAKNGKLTDESVNNELNVVDKKTDVSFYITDKGGCFKLKKEAEKNKLVKNSELEELTYTTQGVELLKQIMLDYHWAMYLNKRHGEMWLPLAMPLDEPSDFVQTWLGEKQGWSDEELLKNSMQHLELVFHSLPLMFFFRLVTFLEPHLLNEKNLWRSGVLAHFFGDENVVALIEVDGSAIHIKVHDKQINPPISIKKVTIR